MNTPLRSGIFLAPFHAKADNPTLAMERDREAVRLVADLLDEVQGGMIGPQHERSGPTRNQQLLQTRLTLLAFGHRDERHMA